MSSSFIGPIETGSSFALSFFTTSGTESQFLVETQLTTTPQAGWRIMTNQGNTHLEGIQFPADGVLVNAVAQLLDPSNNVLDTGSQSANWSSTAGLGVQNLLLSGQTSGQGGFTDSDRALLTKVSDWTVLDTFLTQLPLTDLGVSQPGGSIQSALVSWKYGVLVRMTQIDSSFVAQTPDHDYYVRTLAVVRVFHGTDVLLRVPIHRSSQIVPLEETGNLLQLALASFGLWQPGLTLEVDFETNCAGHVFLLDRPTPPP